jgi:hypothetical protein
MRAIVTGSAACDALFGKIGRRGRLQNRHIDADRTARLVNQGATVFRNPLRNRLDRRNLAPIALAALATIVLSLPVSAENPKIAPSKTLTVVEKVSEKGARKELTAAGLRELVAKGQLREYDSGPVIIYGEHSGDQGVWQFKGVRLIDLVKLATGYKEEMGNALYMKRKGLYVVAYASDAYPGVFSWAELLFTPTGSLALVAYEWKLVKSANAGDRAPFIGDMTMVVPTDTFTGAREVQALKSIELREVGDPAVK